MNYELAKKLKDAGWIFREVRHPLVAMELGMVDFGGIKYYHPTLSELIEACGDKFFWLNRLDRMGNVRWTTEFMEDENSSGEPLYPTPEEAVANLWLTLHESKEEKE